MDDFTKKENALIALGFAILMVQLIITILDSVGVMSKGTPEYFPVNRSFLVAMGFTLVAIFLFKLGSRSNFIILFFLFGAKYFMSPSLDSKGFAIVTVLTVVVMIICNLDRFDDRKRAIALLIIPSLFVIEDVALALSNDMVEIITVMHVVLIVCCFAIIWFLLNGKLNRASQAE